MNEPVYVIFDDPADADAASRALADAENIAPSSEPTILSAPVGQGQIRWRDSRVGAGAFVGACLTAIFGAVVLGLAGASGALLISTPGAVIGGLVGGAIYGFVLGAIAGATEPNPKLRRLRSMLRQGEAALIARYDDPQRADEAEQWLLDRHGARISV